MANSSLAPPHSVSHRLQRLWPSRRSVPAQHCWKFCERHRDGRQLKCFLFLSIFYFLNLPSKLCFPLGIGRGGWLFSQKIANMRHFLQCHRPHRMLLWKPLCHLKDLLCIWDFHHYGRWLTDGNSSRNGNRQGALREKYRGITTPAHGYRRILKFLLTCWHVTYKATTVHVHQDTGSV